MADVKGMYCLAVYGKLMSLHVYPMISLYPMESLDPSSRYMYLSLSLWIKTGAQSRFAVPPRNDNLLLSWDGSQSLNLHGIELGWF